MVHQSFGPGAGINSPLDQEQVCKEHIKKQLKKVEISAMFEHLYRAKHIDNSWKLLEIVFNYY